MALCFDQSCSKKIVLDLLRQGEKTLIWSVPTSEVSWLVQLSGLNKREILVFGDKDTLTETWGALRTQHLDLLGGLATVSLSTQLPYQALAVKLVVVLAHPTRVCTPPSAYHRKCMAESQLVVIWPDAPSAEEAQAWVAKALGRDRSVLMGVDGDAQEAGTTRFCRAVHR